MKKNNSENDYYDDSLDTGGLLCPYPLLKAKERLLQLNTGHILRVTSTDPSSVIDFNVFAATQGYVLLKMNEEKGTYTFFIQKTAYV